MATTSTAERIADKVSPRLLNTVVLLLIVAGAIIIVLVLAAVLWLAVGGTISFKDRVLQFGRPVSEVAVTQLVSTDRQHPGVSYPQNAVELAQRRNMIDLMLNPTPGLGEAGRTIHSCLPDFRVDGFKSSVITAAEAGRIYHDYPELFKAIKTQLDDYEVLSAAYLNGAVDSKMFVDSFKNSILIAYRRYQAAIPVWENDCGCTWRPFETLGKSWAKDIPNHSLVQRGERLKPGCDSRATPARSASPVPAG